MKLKEIKTDTIVHCNTEDEAKQLIKWAYACGYKWEYVSKDYTAWGDNCGNGITYCMEDRYIGDVVNKYISYTFLIKSSAIEFSDLIIDNEDLTAEQVVKWLIDGCYDTRFNDIGGEDGDLYSVFDKDSPEEIVNKIKQYNKKYNKEPEIEWVYECYEIAGKTSVKSCVNNEDKAVKWCEQKAIDFKDSSFKFAYNKICRIKENS